MGTTADQERADFSERLKASLRAADCRTSVATVTRGFNLRADGAGVSVYAVRKWLGGESIPTQDKVHILARWMGVSAQWLRFGENSDSPGAAADFEPRDLQLINDIRLLSESERDVVGSMIGLLLRARQNG